MACVANAYQHGPLNRFHPARKSCLEREEKDHKPIGVAFAFACCQGDMCWPDGSAYTGWRACTL
eukprot:6466568-Amphidinium_carterae.3